MSKFHKLSQVLFLQAPIGKVLSVNSWYFYPVKIISSDKKKLKLINNFNKACLSWHRIGLREDWKVQAESQPPFPPHSRTQVLPALPSITRAC